MKIFHLNVTSQQNLNFEDNEKYIKYLNKPDSLSQTNGSYCIKSTSNKHESKVVIYIQVQV